MNNDEYAKVCQDPNAKACIFAINATQQLNSDIAIGFRKILMKIKLIFLLITILQKKKYLLKIRIISMRLIWIDKWNMKIHFLKPKQ